MPKTAFRPPFSLFVAAFAIASHNAAWSASGQCEIIKLFADGPTESPEFGFSVSTDGFHAAFGAPRDQTLGLDAGAVYVSARSHVSWSTPIMVLAEDGAEFDSFGASVSLDGAYLAVGTPADDDVAFNSGAVYLFRLQGGAWVQQTKLVRQESVENEEFGFAVALHGGILVAAARTDAAGLSSGSVFVYQLADDSWNFEAELTAEDAAKGDLFGESVAVSEGQIVIGARQNDKAEDGAGAVYVFRKIGGAWTQEKQLLSNNARIGDEFGVSVAVDDAYLIVGARLADRGMDTNAGAAYVFRRQAGDWVQEAVLGASDPADNDQFGVSVGISGNHAIVGAWQDADAGRNTGSAYVFERKGTTWNQVGKLLNGFPTSMDDFGFAVSAGGVFALAGIPGDDGAGSRAGSANVYAIGGDCNHNGFPDVCDILEGVAPDEDGDGIPDTCPSFGDADIDGDVDLRDAARFQNCFSGNGGTVSSACFPFDEEPDDDVDLTDLSVLQTSLDGPL